MTTLHDKATQAGLSNATFDYAYPQLWANEVHAWTGLWPRGVVWLYDHHAHIFGRPYPLTLYAWIVLRLYWLRYVQHLSDITWPDFIPIYKGGVTR